jgi:hypothetical protein
MFESKGGGVAANGTGLHYASATNGRGRVPEVVFQTAGMFARLRGDLPGRRPDCPATCATLEDDVKAERSGGFTYPSNIKLGLAGEEVGDHSSDSLFRD